MLAAGAALSGGALGGLLVAGSFCGGLFVAGAFCANAAAPVSPRTNAETTKIFLSMITSKCWARENSAYCHEPTMNGSGREPPRSRAGLSAGRSSLRVISN